MSFLKFIETRIGATLSSAMGGAFLGTIFAGRVGAIIGAVLGGIAGFKLCNPK